MTSPDPNSYIQESAALLGATLVNKNSDYAPTGEFSNFEKAAEIADIKTIQVMASQAAIKMTRIQSLMERNGDEYNYESLKDSFLDLAGYAVIAHAYLEYTGGHGEPSPSAFDYRSAAHERMREMTEAITEDREKIRNTMEDPENKPHNKVHMPGSGRKYCYTCKEYECDE